MSQEEVREIKMYDGDYHGRGYGSCKKEDKGVIRVKGKMVLRFLLLFIVLSFSAHSYVCASDSEYIPDTARWNTESAVIAGYGKGDVAEGTYEPVLLIWRLGCNLKQFSPSLENHRGSLSFYMEPQINPVFKRETDIEFGIGLGFKYMYPLTDSMGAYLFGSVGPHYVSVKTSDQANGFIFSDTIGIGLSFFLTKKSAIIVEYRRRHMSNGDMEKPNGGIDTNSATIGYSVFF